MQTSKTEAGLIETRARYQQMGIYLGPAIAIAMLIVGPQSTLSDEAWRTAALGLWMAVWWATEATPVGVTAFIPLIFFAPFGITTLHKAAAPYANPILYLYLGGFLIALAMQRWDLHKRIALALLTVSGTNGRSLIGGFMVTAALLSMWMTNTSTTMMLLPIVISVIAVIAESVKEIDDRERRNFEIGLLLGTAFGATIGGVATLVGTPPNAFLAAFLAENYDIEISFARWMLAGVPVTIVLLPLCWITLTRLIYPISFETSTQTQELLKKMRADLGSASRAEWRIGIVFSCVVIGWMTRPWLTKFLPIEGLSDPGIVMIAAFLLFLLPSTGRRSPRLLTWADTRDLPWAILILFGGGLSLAASVSETGLAHWLGTSLVPLGALGIGAIVVGAVVLVIFLTELTSNLATTATLLPVLAALALELGVSPVVLTVPVALAASCAFMLPVATPPNAIVYGSGRLTIPQMAKAGLVMNVIGIILLSLVALLLAPVVFADEKQPSEVPLTIVIEGGMVFRGDGKEGMVTDVGISADRIIALGDLSSADAELRLDASGLAVTPGFIDIHSHAVRDSVEESGIFLWPDAENYIRQGVTTAIGGPDGSSWYPISELLQMLKTDPSSVNFGTFVGHNTVRELAMGRADRAPTTEEMQAMRSMVETAMQEGAFGLSSGLKYIPGAYSNTGEVISLARVAAQYGGIYITHMREEGVGLLDSVRETIRIGEEGGLPAQITHHKAMGARTWGKSKDTLALVDAANARGLDITSDQYPYAASSTDIDVLFPAWSLAGDKATRLARLNDPDTRTKIKAGIIDNLVNDRGGNDPSRVAIADCNWAPELNGKNLVEILREREQEASMENAAELAMELEEKGGCRAVYHSMSEEDVTRIMRHPKTMIASDGGIHMPANDRPHPRNYGSFARVLGLYVREKNLIGFSEAIHKMTRMPADRIGLHDRGRIEVGAIADIAVLDPDKVIDRATFKEPHQLSEGVHHVLVNGQAVLLNGEMTGERPGHVLRSSVPVEKTYGLGLPRDLELLAVPDENYPDWPLREDQAAYAMVDGERMKQWVRKISAISLRSQADGDRYWGRLPGTVYDTMTMDLMIAEFERLGLETERIPFILPSDWTPVAWRASYSGGGVLTELTSAFPVGQTAATPPGGVSAEAVWVGVGSEPDFLGREVEGKAVVIYSTFVPGGRSHSASSRAGIFNANQRASEHGAAMIINVMAVPGDGRFNPLGAPSAEYGVPLITISQDEGFRLRDILGSGAKVEIRLELDIEIRKNIKTANVVARLPGASDEEIVLAAHTDGFFQGAMDNASGLASALEIARHHAAIPREQRPRTLIFFLFPDHHHGEEGLRSWEQAHDWNKVAMALTLEHPSQTQLYWYNDDLMTSNAIGAFRWNALGSSRFVELVNNTLRNFGVSVYTEMNPRPKLTRQAPGFHIIDHVIYHTTLDIPELVPAEGLERSTRAFLSVMDQVNGMSLDELRVREKH